MSVDIEDRTGTPETVAEYDEVIEVVRKFVVIGITKFPPEFAVLLLFLAHLFELQQVLGKLIQVAGSTEHWDGDLRPRLIEELGDVSGAIAFFMEKNLVYEEEGVMLDRAKKKLELFRKWHDTGDTRPVFDPPTRQMTEEEKREFSRRKY